MSSNAGKMPGFESVELAFRLDNFESSTAKPPIVLHTSITARSTGKNGRTPELRHPGEPACASRKTLKPRNISFHVPMHSVASATEAIRLLF
jgi:hypothetical protein